MEFQKGDEREAIGRRVGKRDESKSKIHTDIAEPSSPEPIARGQLREPLLVHVRAKTNARASARGFPPAHPIRRAVVLLPRPGGVDRAMEELMSVFVNSGQHK
jgi:hypothetical protein